MKENFEKTYHELEKSHWWFKSRRGYIRDLLSHFDKNSKILDIGCSSGILLSELKEQGFNEHLLFGVDISQTAIDRCRQNGIRHTYVMDAQQIELSETFDVIVASDCLEHLQHDHQALRKWLELLNPGGTLFVFVPAYSFLWSDHDVANMHYRRYTKGSLIQALQQEQFQVVHAGYWNSLLFLPVTVIRLFSRLLPTKEAKACGHLFQLPRLLNTMLATLLYIENKLIKYINFPFGISTYCIAKKSIENGGYK